MQTYYQKHRQIDAFQFDGSFIQLINELPTEITSELINHLAKLPSHQPPKWNRDDHGNVTNLFAKTRNWPLDNDAMHHIRNFHQLRLYYKRLHIGDYMWVTHPHAHWKHLLNPRLNQYVNQNYNHHNLIWVTWPMVQFTSAKNFKAHWSNTPLRK